MENRSGSKEWHANSVVPRNQYRIAVSASTINPLDFATRACEDVVGQGAHLVNKDGTDPGTPYLPPLIGPKWQLSQTSGCQEGPF